MAKYKVDTDKGSYIVETEDPVPGMEKLGGVAPRPAAPPLPRSSRAATEWSTALEDAPKSVGENFGRIVTAPLTGIMGIGSDIIDWAKRGGRTTGPTGGFISEEPVTQAYNDALMALGTEYHQTKPRPNQQFTPSAWETGGKAVSGGIKAGLKSMRTGRSTLPGLAGYAAGNVASALTGIPGLGKIGAIVAGAPELIKAVREGAQAEMHPPNPYATKGAMATQLARDLDPYANPTPRDPWSQAPQAPGPNVPSTFAPTVVEDAAPRQGRTAPMDYEAPPARRSTTAKPKAEPKPKAPSKQERAATAARLDPYANPPARDPGLPPMPGTEIPPPPEPISQGVGAGSMEFGGPEPPPPPTPRPKVPTKAEKAANTAAAQAGYEPPKDPYTNRPTLPPEPAPSEEWLRSPAGQEWQQRQGKGVGAGSMEFEAPASKPGKEAKGASSETAGGLPKDVTEAQIQAELDKLRAKQRPPREPEKPRQTTTPPGEAGAGPLVTPESERLPGAEPPAEAEPQQAGEPGKTGALSSGHEGAIDIEYVKKIAESAGESVRTRLFHWLHEAYRDLHKTTVGDTHPQLSNYIKKKYGLESMRDLTVEQAMEEYNLLNRAAHAKREAPK